MENVSFEKINYIKALTIKERADIYYKLGINNFSYSEMQKWMDIRGVVSEDDIYKMIELNNMSNEDYNRGLKALDDIEEAEKVKIWDECSNQDWYKQYMEIIDNYMEEYQKVNASTIDLSLSLTPFILWSGKQLKKEIDKLKNITVSQQASLKLIQKVVSVLLNLCMKTLVWELHVYGHENKDKFADSKEDNEIFKKFIEDTFLNKDMLINFYRRYPVIARRATIKCIQITNHYREMLSRIDSDFEEIKSKLNLENISNKITDINCDQGDTHEQGRFVVKVKFDEDTIVYKPRNLQVEEKFYELIEFINSNSEMLDLYVNKSLYRDEYTIESFVEYEPCKTEEDVIKFYKRFGQICALIYILNGNDIHYENVIAFNEYPVIVDMETLFQHQSDVLNLDANALVRAYKECLHSVVGTALLPIITFAKDKNTKGIDISALNGGEQVLPYKMLSLKDANKDTMRYEYDEVKISAANNIPILNGEKVSFIKYVDYIIESFKECLTYIMENKDKIVGEDGIVNIFKDIRVRHLLKATQSYAKIMAFSSHPNYEEDIIYLERLFTNIWNYNYKDKRALKYEFEDMIWGDIPIFYGKIDSRDLISSKGEEIVDFFEKSAIDKVISKVKELDCEVIAKQVAQIKISLGQYESINKKRFLEKDKIVKVNNEFNAFKNDKDREKLLKEIEVIADKIADSAIYDEKSNTITWNNVVYDEINECFKVRFLDNSLGDGLSGVLLFYYMVKKYTKTNKFDSLIESILNSILTIDIPNDKFIPLESNLGMLYVLSIINRNKNLDGIKIKMYKVFKDVEKQAAELDSANIQSGYFGIVNILLKIYNNTENQEILKLINKYMNIIIDKIDADAISDLDLLNVLYIIKEVRNVLDKETLDKYLDLDKRINIENIMKLNSKKCINDLALLNSQEQYVEYNCFEYEKCNNDTLLEGSMYDLNILLNCLESKETLEVERLVNEYIVKLLYNKNKIGDYLYYGVEGYMGVGLLHGLSGIGYTLLRVYSNCEVPDVFNLR